MIRGLFWLLVWILTGFTLSIHVEYADGLRINFTGWLAVIAKRRKDRGSRHE